MMNPLPLTLLFLGCSASVLPARASAPVEPPTRVQDEDPFDTTPRRLDGPHFAVQSLWFSERDPEHAAKAALAILEAVATVEIEGLVPMPEAEEPVVVGLALTPGVLRKQLGGDVKQPLRAFVPKVRIPGVPEAGMDVVAVAPAIHDRILFEVTLPPATARALAFVAAAHRLANTPDVPADGAARAGLRAALVHGGLTAAQRGHSEPWLDPILSTGYAQLRTELTDAAADLRAERFLALVEQWELEVAASEVRTFDAEAGLGAPPGEIAARLLHDAGGDLRRASEHFLVRSSPSAEASSHLPLDPHWRVESASVGIAADATMAVGTRRTDALAIGGIVREGPLDARVEVYMVPTDPRFGAQADLVFGDANGDRYLIALNSREGPYLFRRRGPDAPYEPLAELKELELPIRQWIPVRASHDGTNVQVHIADKLILSFREEERSLDGAFGLGAHAGTIALFRNLRYR